jgi:uncharacterized protein DUF1615
LPRASEPRFLRPSMTCQSARSTPPGVRWIEFVALVVAFAMLGGCASGPSEPGVHAPPALDRPRIASLLPAGTADREGWAADLEAALRALDVVPTADAVCEVIAVAAQESGLQVDPQVPGLGRIARAELYRRAEAAHVPGFLVAGALALQSTDGRTYGARIDAAHTERDLSEAYEDLIARVPLGSRLLADENPVRTAGPMQVSIAFAERQVRERTYPWPQEGSVRHQVFSRRGGLYFGAAHLLDYAAPYDRPLFRFADFNAGRWASRNAAFQAAVALVSGEALDLDGDLVVPGSTEASPGRTELAVRAVQHRLEGRVDPTALHADLRAGEGPGFEDSTLWRHVFALADAQAGHALPRALVPRIELHSPKLSRRFTTAAFAQRVDERYHRCRDAAR